MTPHDPDISVVVPCRNELATLPQCLDALEAQDYPRERFEVILIDGRSTDGCAEHARGRGLRPLHDHGTGPSGARNVGIMAARGAIIAFTDADCVPAPDWLTSIAEVFTEDPRLAGVSGALRMPRHGRLGILEDMEARMHYRGFITSNVAYRRDVLLEMGGFDEELRCAEDYDLAWRVLDAGHRVRYDPRPLVIHAPPELSGSKWAYLRKQFWYARHDVPTHARAIQRSRGQPLAGSSAALGGALSAVRNATWTVAAGTGLVLGSPALVGASVLGATLASGRHVWRTARRAGEDARHVPGMVAIETAKRVARGLGTMVGIAELARPSSRRFLTAAPAGAIAPPPTTRVSRTGPTPHPLPG